jgi:hypothetical protein
MSLLHLTDDRPTLAAVLWPQARMSPALRNAALALGGTVLLWLLSKIQIPLYPVPVTMQTLVVLVLGVAYGWRLGVATMALYLVEGAIGLPVFAGGWSEGAGFHNLYGPTAYRRYERRALELEGADPGTLPSDAVLEVSGDGVTWRQLATETRWRAPLRWGGITGLADGIRGLRFDVPPTRLRALRVTAAHDFAGGRWTIRELTVYVDE